MFAVFAEQVLDLSSNEFSAEGVGVIADATRNAAGLRQLRLLGNKIPFGLDTLRKLMQVGGWVGDAWRWGLYWHGTCRTDAGGGHEGCSLHGWSPAWTWAGCVGVLPS